MTQRELAWAQSTLKRMEAEAADGFGFLRLYGLRRSVFLLVADVYASQERYITAEGAAVATIETPSGFRGFAFALTQSPRTAALDRRLYAYSAARKRRIRQNRAEGFHLPEHLALLWQIQDGRCYFSGEPLGSSFEDSLFQVDHLVPLVASHPCGVRGTNWPTNLALVTPRVNQMKGSLAAATFAASVRRRRAFELRPKTERTTIDAARARVFASFMRNETISKVTHKSARPHKPPRSPERRSIAIK